MPLELEATAGADDANAYATVEETDEYAAYRIGGAAFTALTPDQKIQALVTAATDIDSLEEDPGFIDDRTFEDQALAWPRGDEDLPANLVKAAMELAISYAPLFAAGATGDALSPDPNNGNIKRKKTDVLEKEYFAPTKATATSIERFPAMVQRLLSGLVLPRSTSSWGSATVTRTS